MATKAAKPLLQKSAPDPPSNAATSLQVPLPQMLDLALGTPEVLLAKIIFFNSTRLSNIINISQK